MYLESEEEQQGSKPSLKEAFGIDIFFFYLILILPYATVKQYTKVVNITYKYPTNKYQRTINTRNANTIHSKLG
jgi:hypothetical protein